jgi:hypothetical protein
MASSFHCISGGSSGPRGRRERAQPSKAEKEHAAQLPLLQRRWLVVTRYTRCTRRPDASTAKCSDRAPCSAALYATHRGHAHRTRTRDRVRHIPLMDLVPSVTAHVAEEECPLSFGRRVGVAIILPCLLRRCRHTSSVARPRSYRRREETAKRRWPRERTTTSMSASSHAEIEERGQRPVLQS